jgi:predicted MFS family arabinose efflux permease
MTACNRHTKPDELNGGRSLCAAIALTVIAMAAFLVLPVFIGAVAEDLGLSQQQLGFLAAFIASGSALSSIAMMFLVRRYPWRRMGTVALCLLLLPMTLSLFVEQAGWFMLLQGIAALGGGSTYSLALTALADRRHPDRAFGFSVAAQVTFQVLGMLLLPQLVSRAGIDAILGVFVTMELVGLLLVHWLPQSGKSLPPVTGKAAVASVPVLLALLGCFLFFVNVGAVWTYVERIGDMAGLGAQAIGNGLAIGVSLGIPGALLASWCGDRFGRLWPLALGSAGTVIALLLLGDGVSWGGFVIAVALYNFVWNFSLAFQYAAVHAVDPGGRGVAAAPAFHGAGAAAGPALAALYVSETSLAAANVVAGVAVVASLLLFTAALLLADRQPVSREVI